MSLSRAFRGSYLFGEETLKSFLLEAFFVFVSHDEAEILKQCTEADFDLNSDEFLDVLSSCKYHKAPNKDNVLEVISQLAHQELVQKPKYVSNCWSPIVARLKNLPQFRSLEELAKLYLSRKPTGRKVVKLLEGEPSTTSQEI